VDQICIGEPKQCITTPCDQFTCTDIGSKAALRAKRSSASTTIAQVVAFERHFASQCLAQHAATPRWEPFVKFESLADKMLGVVGFGAIGEHVARVARLGFGMRVVALARTARASSSEEVERIFTPNELPELLQVCDYVLCLLPATVETRGMLDGGVLAHCKRGALLVNAGRGSLLSEESILQAMTNRWIRGFIGDVWPVEPLPSDSPLWRTEGVIVSPHVAAKPTPYTVRRVFERNLATFAKDGVDVLPHRLQQLY
jgi:phosphoglycerate dehydrogenase-like enzyme